MENPGLPVRLRERVHVEYRLPRRRGCAVGGERGPPPDAPLVRVVPPEVVDGLTAELGRRDLLLRVQDLQRALVDRLVFRASLQEGGRLRVVLPRPIQGLLALDLLQPLERILSALRGHRRRPRHGQRHRRHPSPERLHASSSHGSE